MFRSIQWRITVWFVLLVIICMTALGIFLTSSVRNNQVESLRIHLENEAKITAEASLTDFLDREMSDLDILAKKLGDQISARITIIDPDGFVLGDSEEDPLTMDNHAVRPEIVSALASGIGETTRYSITLGKQMMYVAVPVMNNGEILGVARVALPLTQVESSVNRVIVTIVIATAVAAALVILAAWLVAKITTQPIREVTRASRQIAAGNFSQKITAGTGDEAGQLARAFNEMSAKLKDMVTTISEDRLRLSGILDNMVDGVILTDAEGNIIQTNKAVRNLLSIDETAVRGKPVIEAVREHELSELLNACLETGQQKMSQFTLSKPTRFLQAIAIPVTGGKSDGALLMIQDLTELRNLQTMRRDLVGNISHEFRTPLAGIKVMVETLQDGAIDEKETAKDFLSRIESEVDRMTQLVGELTELSRIETGKAVLKLELVNLNSLAEEVVAQLKPLAERQNLTLQTTLADDLPPLQADKERIRQVLVNLIHNAIKFNRPGGSVITSTRHDKGSVFIDVADTGTGIARDDLPHIFERFFKSDKSRSQQGTGIGLAIVKHTIEAHRGRIWVRSEEGEGSTFSFSLPIQ